MIKMMTKCEFCGEYLMPFEVESHNCPGKKAAVDRIALAQRQFEESLNQLNRNIVGVKEQPAPTKNDYPAIWDLVLDDIRQRDSVGQNRYGVRLQPFNGRDMLQDVYEELLDAVVYIRGVIYERDHQNG